MTLSPHDPSTDPQATIAATEARLRVLHELRAEARLHGDFESRYVEFVRTLRERLHPRGVSDLQTIDVEGGLRMTVDVGDRLGCDIFYGYYEEAFEARLFGAVIQPGAVVADVGANFGYYTLIGARAAGPTGRTYAFEPDPGARDLLQRNVSANELQERVTILPSAIGDADGEVAFHIAEEPAFSGLYDFGRSPVRDTLTLSIRSLDSLTDEHQIATIDAIKIDVEGHDAPVLRGASALLQRSPDPLIVLEISAKNLDDGRRTALHQALIDLEAEGYYGRIVDLGAEGGLRTVPPEVAVTLGAVSLLLTRRDTPTDARLGAILAEQVATLSAPLEVRSLGGEPRPLALFAGLDPALIVSALRDKLALQDQFDELYAEAGDLRDERTILVKRVEQLVQEKDSLTEVVERLTAESVGLRGLLEQAQARAAEQRGLAEQLSAENAALRTLLEQAQAAEHREMAERLWGEVQETRSLLQQAQAQAAEHRTQVERRWAQLQEARAQIQDLEATVKRQNGEIARLQRTPLGLLNRAAQAARDLGAGRKEG